MQHYDVEFTVVFIICVTLAIGALMRAAARITRIPFTIAVMLVGVGAGFALRQVGEHGPPLFSEVLASGAEISPHLIIFVFLPALVFESAFALDAYSFRRNIGACVTLAVPALVVSTVGTALLMVGITAGGWQWSLSAGLVFGALISATDPVAVVAILREAGAPKRLGVLIEGESLLNDGTAIVVFKVVLAVLLAGGWGATNMGETGLEFVKVVTGGVVVGLVLAFVVSEWMGRTFNEPLVEITLTIVLAYACMIVAEGLLHVSGVMALVAAGLYMGSRGRTHISPEVEHFLHEFWEMVAYIANTLIFFLVGLVIARQIHSARLMDLFLILGVYAGIMVLRFGITFAFLPVINRVSDPVSSNEAKVMSWGGLRGAVSLALALIVYQHPDIAPVVRDQILLVTAGVVFLTIAINGGTTGMLLGKLGFNKLPPAEQVAELTAMTAVLDGVRDKIGDVSQSRELRTVSWNEVTEDLHHRRGAVVRELSRVSAELQAVTGEARAAGYWQQALRMERQAYWQAFAHGTLGALATRVLDREIDTQLDRLNKGSPKPPPTRVPSMLRRRALGRSKFGGRQFDRLELLYDMSRAESQAAERVLTWLDGLVGVDSTELAPIRSAYQRYARTGKERLEDLRANLPEVTRAIETRLAKRIQLNFERDAYKAMLKRGTMDPKTAGSALEEVEAQMKRLRGRAHEVPLPETAELCRSTPLFEALDEETIALLADMTIEQALSPGELLVREGDKGDSLYIVARGAVHVVKELDGDEEILGVLGGGDIVGEMSLLTGAPRTATIRAATTVTLGRINRADFDQLMETKPELRTRIWSAFARNRFDNFLRSSERFGHLTHDDRERWIGDQPVAEVAAGGELATGEASYLFVATGEVEVGGAVGCAPAMVQVAHQPTCKAVADARVVLLPPYDQAIG